MYCKYCGKETENQDSICDDCYKNAENIVNETRRLDQDFASNNISQNVHVDVKPASKKGKPFGIIGMIVGIILLIVANAIVIYWNMKYSYQFSGYVFTSQENLNAVADSFKKYLVVCGVISLIPLAFGCISLSMAKSETKKGYRAGSVKAFGIIALCLAIVVILNVLLNCALIGRAVYIFR